MEPLAFRTGERSTIAPAEITVQEYVSAGNSPAEHLSMAAVVILTPSGGVSTGKVRQDQRRRTRRGSPRGGLVALAALVCRAAGNRTAARQLAETYVIIDFQPGCRCRRTAAISAAGGRIRAGRVFKVTAAAGGECRANCTAGSVQRATARIQCRPARAAKAVSCQRTSRRSNSCARTAAPGDPRRGRARMRHIAVASHWWHRFSYPHIYQYQRSELCDATRRTVISGSPSVAVRRAAMFRSVTRLNLRRRAWPCPATTCTNFTSWQPGSSVNKNGSFTRVGRPARRLVSTRRTDDERCLAVLIVACAGGFSGLLSISSGRAAASLESPAVIVRGQPRPA